MTGVAELKKNIYVVMNHSNKMNVFGRPPWYNRLDDIVVKEMKNPRDLAADLTTGHLYIADGVCRCMWRLEIKGEQDSDDKEKIKVEKWNIEGGIPLSLSITKTGQVLVVGGSGDVLTLIGGKGDKPEVINLNNKGLSDTRHVIQSSSETFLVAHEDRVSLVDRNWKVLKQYGGPVAPLGLSEPHHLVEVSGHMFVVDKKRVLVLSNRLEAERTLVLRPSVSEDPLFGWRKRLCYSRSSGRLLVSWDRKYVLVYSVT